MGPSRAGEGLSLTLPILCSSLVSPLKFLLFAGPCTRPWGTAVSHADTGLPSASHHPSRRTDGWAHRGHPSPAAVSAGFLFVSSYTCGLWDLSSLTRAGTRGP